MFKKFFDFLLGHNGSENASASGCCSGNGGSLRDLEGFVTYVARSLVDAPDEVQVRTEETPEGCSIKISCKKEDIGKIVGKRGKTIMAIRSLVSGAAGRQRRRVSVEVLD